MKGNISPLQLHEISQVSIETEIFSEFDFHIFSLFEVIEQ